MMFYNHVFKHRLFSVYFRKIILEMKRTYELEASTVSFIFPVRTGNINQPYFVIKLFVYKKEI